MRNVRVWFTKKGQAKYISHLDMNRCMTRAVRRAELPLWFTEGFNTHPYMTFSLPLPLGVESLCESMDIRIIDENFTNDNVKESLNRVLPVGIEVTRVNDIVMKAGEIAFADYLIHLDVPNNADAIEKIKQALDSGELLAEKKGKSGKRKVVKTVNLAEYVKNYSISSNDSGVELKMTLAAGINKNVNPILLINTVLQKSGVECDSKNYMRLALYTQEMEQFA